MGAHSVPVGDTLNEIAKSVVHVVLSNPTGRSLAGVQPNGDTAVRGEKVAQVCRVPLRRADLLVGLPPKHRCDFPIHSAQALSIPKKAAFLGQKLLNWKALSVPRGDLTGAADD